MNLASYIEHTNLNPTLTIQDIDKLVEEAKQYGFLGICVPPFWVERAQREIGNEEIILVTVAGFPLGYNMTETKLDEMKRAIDNGADEIDVVWNVSSFKTNLPWTKIEVAKCSKLAHEHQKIVKVIIETAYLSETELEQACKICADAGVDFVKTSTGLAPSGAKVEDVKRMREFLPSHTGIKASGGIKTLEQTQALIAAGADRIGTSSGIAIIYEIKTKP
ncbi:MAG TPA: deoxyribose-phosphate aldolase [Chryseolinea sp.]|nr:deoxyribose-phosphate aldolase [Chryseolinea sp.]HPH46028.1 deoxyribose-phosphate aldolase [Chryseolinea sp.]HPM29385.1 deoxyribose-phosphate aldolase [Chryseolinea sp.]